ncbi:MAG: hypothetical protein ACTSRP_02010 [Candidatus Helarchaeota archaeon]
MQFKEIEKQYSKIPSYSPRRSISSPLSTSREVQEFSFKQFLNYTKSGGKLPGVAVKKNG